MIVLIVCFLLSLLLIVQAIQLGIGPVATSFKALKALKRHLPKNLNRGKIVDLGSGFGLSTLWLARQYPKHEVVGYELSWIPYLFSKLIFFYVKNLSFSRKCIYSLDLSDKPLIYSYLYTKGMCRLRCKPFSGLWISYSFSHPSAKLFKTISVHDLYSSCFFFYY